MDNNKIVNMFLSKFSQITERSAKIKIITEKLPSKKEITLLKDNIINILTKEDWIVESLVIKLEKPSFIVFDIIVS